MAGRTAIPARIIIGVTGHRRLDNEPALASDVALVLDKIERLIPTLHTTPVEFTVLSPLAEGADRLVALEVLKKAGAQLEVVLPMEENEYAADFELPGSRAEFETLVRTARTRRRLPPSPSPAEAYAKAGRYVVDHCDLLIALWDGEPENGRGGTSEIVGYARKTRCPLFWIRTDRRQDPTLEPGRGINIRAVQSLDDYNSEHADERRVMEKTTERCRVLREKARAAGFPLDRLHEICAATLSHYYRTDILALRYQHLYYKAGSLVYALATAAVAAAAFQALFFPHWPRLAIIEVVLIGIALAVVWLGQRRRWHFKWIDYRFLAERFRSALFLAFARMEITALRPPRSLSLSYSSRDWMIGAFMSFWSRLPRSETAGGVDFASLKAFILDAWVDDQTGYHKSTSRRHGRRHTRLTWIGNSLFGLTFAAALFHFMGLGGESLGRVLLLVAIVSPAVAGALGAIRTHREYFRNAHRSQEMARHLEEIKVKMAGAENMDAFLPLVHEAEEVMLLENADWRVVVRFHELEPPA